MTCEVAWHGLTPDKGGMNRYFAIAPFVLLAACGLPPATPDQPDRPIVPIGGADTCNAGQYQSLIGQDVTALERVLLLAEVRVIRPNQAVTLDYRQGRINFIIGEAGQIVSITCG